MLLNSMNSPDKFNFERRITHTEEQVHDSSWQQNCLDGVEIGCCNRTTGRDMTGTDAHMARIRDLLL